MVKLGRGFELKEDSQRLYDQLWALMNREREKFKRLTCTARIPETGEYIIAVDTDSDNAVSIIENSGGREIQLEYLEALGVWEESNS